MKTSERILEKKGFSGVIEGFSALHFFLAKSLIQKSAHVCPKYERGKRRFVTPAPPASASPAAASAEISTQRDLAGA